MCSRTTAGVRGNGARRSSRTRRSPIGNGCCGMKFGGSRVDAFGISQYLSCQENEKRAVGQLLIYDFKGPDDFVIELKTKATGHRLILAKVTPQGTLGELVSSVEKRLRSSAPDRLDECNDLLIPVLDFDVTHDFRELLGQRISSANPKLNGTPIAIARQNVRFRLDETGAVIKSEAIFAAGIGANLVFDKPFLVMLKKQGRSVPYFALWVDNPEILVTHGIR